MDANEEPLNPDNASSIKLIEDAINTPPAPQQEPIIVDIGSKDD